MAAGLGRLLAFILALSIVVSYCPGISASELPETEPAFTEATVPEETLPEETLPEDTQPEETIPEETGAEEPLPEETIPVEPQVEEMQAPMLLAPTEPSGPGLYFGQLHSHTDISEGTVPPEEAFHQASETPGLDFFAVTDHSHSFDGHLQSALGSDGTTLSEDWAAGKAAAEAVTGPDFLGIFGYEMSWPANMQIGHISTFCTPGFQSWQQEDYRKFNGALDRYYAAMASVPGAVGQFNHPGTRFGSFQELDYSENADRVMSLMEVGDGERYYIKALDQGWHLAPSGLARTVVHAEALTESALFEAIGNLCVYTTEDTDLEVQYTAKGHPMGSRLKRRHIDDQLTLSVTLNDPSDSAAGLVEVITTGGKTVGEKAISGSSGTLEFCLPPESGYYYLRITQPDGDMALTAPIWLDAEEQLGISDLTSETPVPIQKGELLLSLELYNRETVDFQVTGLELTADGAPVTITSDLTRIPAGSSITHQLSCSADCVGRTELTLRLTGTLEGNVRTFEASLAVNFRQSGQVTSIYVDGSHANMGLEQLSLLNQLAMDQDIRMTILEDIPDPQMLEECRLLIVSAPTRPFSEAFVQMVADFAAYGGSILVCGQADGLGGTIQTAGELNRLLVAAGSSMGLKTDTVENRENNGGTPGLIFSDTLLRTGPWCGSISEDQVYRFENGCSVDPGEGTPLAWGSEDTVFLAGETLSGGGMAFVSGSFFLNDGGLREPKNIWQEPYANRAIAEAMLGIGGEALPLCTIAEARAAQPGTPVRIRGYATTGTSNLHNTFPDRIYLQDETGAIAITAFTGSSIQQGAPLEIRGFANGDQTMKTGSWEILDADFYQYPPLEGGWDTLLDLSENSQRLVQVEGKCLEIYCREDGLLAGCLLEDSKGETVRVTIEEYIRNGSDGENPLEKMIRKNRTIRAVGLLHQDDYGAAVIRVRNCEEVVWVPQKDYVNPKTGDPLTGLLPHM